jgi:arginase
MLRPIAVVGAASSIGIKPYDDGTMRQLDRAPDALRNEGVISRLGARDHGNVTPPPYLDFVRPPMRARNESAVVSYSRELARSIATAADDGSFVLALGGDCSIVLGGLLGVRAGGDTRIGLVYVDAHGDFATPEESVTGSVAAMCTALAVGRGDSPLARLAGATPLVRETDVVLIGRRDEAYGGIYGQGALGASAILDIPHNAVCGEGPAETARTALNHLAHSGVPRFWIHVDVDVLDPSVMPAVDSPEPNGLSVDELIRLLSPLISDQRAAGLELTIYDPHLDPDHACAKTLVSLLERALTPERIA